MSATPRKDSKKPKVVEPIPIYRRSAPHAYDQAKKGTNCIVTHDDKLLLYIQTSEDENNPCWELVGDYTPPPTF